MPFQGNSHVFVTDAQQLAMGIGTPTDPVFGIVQIDGNTVWGAGGYDLAGALVHEETEAIGRLSTDNPAAPTVLDLAKEASTDLPFAPGGSYLDPGDWAPGTPPDAFDAEPPPGVPLPMSLMDLFVIADAGYRISDRVSVAINPDGSGAIGIDSITASAGQITFASIVPGDDAHQLNASAGNTTLAAGFSSGPTVYRLSADGVVIAGNGDNTIYAGAGNDSIWTGGGANRVVLDAASMGAGSATITFLDFTLGRNSIDLVGYGPNGAAEAAAREVRSSAGVQITLSDGTRLQFNELSSVPSADFLNG